MRQLFKIQVFKEIYWSVPFHSFSYVETRPVQFGVPPIKKARRKLPEHMISTVYDPPAQVDPKEPLLLRSEDTTLKHRQSLT